MRWFKPRDKVKCIRETIGYTVGKIYIVKRFSVSISSLPDLPNDAPENYAYIPYNHDESNGRIANVVWTHYVSFILVNNYKPKAPKWL